jgi:hypothetical protein
MYLSSNVLLAVNIQVLCSRCFDGDGLSDAPEESAIYKAVSSRIVHAVRRSIFFLLSLNAIPTQRDRQHEFIRVHY